MRLMLSMGSRLPYNRLSLQINTYPSLGPLSFNLSHCRALLGCLGYLNGSESGVAKGTRDEWLP